MSKPKKLTHFCEVCQVEHTFIEGKWPYWKQKKILKQKTKFKNAPVGLKTIYWCNKGIDCAGCKEVHKRVGATKALTDRETGKTYWVCNKWFKRTGNGQIQWDNWSPQEVMSGVPYGMDRQQEYGPDTEDHSIVQSKQEKDLEVALDELSEIEAGVV